ncbi:hypothetical protein K9M79_03710 [Candidatus Woesearchaeota archaeon]|nr:hypothetical protein [Candidatus Woesearchaeota archaeon]
MNVLTIHDGHDAGASYSHNGKIIAAVNEERLNRQKLFCGFPTKSIKFVVTGKVDEVHIASKFTPASFLRISQPFYGLMRKDLTAFDPFMDMYSLYQTILKNFFPLRFVDMFFSYLIIWFRLCLTIGFICPCAIRFKDHHEMHAIAAYKNSIQGKEASGKKIKKLIISCDHIGDGVSTSVFVSGKKRLDKVFEQGIDGSLGLFYAKYTDLLGFTPGKEEGKIMGLAAYGDDLKIRLIKFENNKGKKERFVTSKMSLNAMYGYFKKGTQAQHLAATAQANLEEAVTDFIRFLVNKYKVQDIVLTGGVFANVKLNQSIMEMSEVKSIYVYPHMGDGGLCMGDNKFESLFLGPEYSDEYIRMLLDKRKIKYKKLSTEIPSSQLSERLAKALISGKIIGLYEGKMELGPRALGHRSVICQGDFETIKEVLNEKLKRDDFMPFAPVVMEDHFSRCFHGVLSEPARYMAITYKATKYMEVNCPAGVHYDGTSRPQVVSKGSLLYDIISEYYKLRTVPCILNTSFNMHDEPIVCTPEEALKAFKAAKLNYLCLGGYFISYEDNFNLSKGR